MLNHGLCSYQIWLFDFCFNFSSLPLWLWCFFHKHIGLTCQHTPLKADHWKPCPLRHQITCTLGNFFSWLAFKSLNEYKRQIYHKARKHEIRPFKKVLAEAHDYYANPFNKDHSASSSFTAAPEMHQTFTTGSILFFVWICTHARNDMYWVHVWINVRIKDKFYFCYFSFPGTESHDLRLLSRFVPCGKLCLVLF